jgi:hypothetical protein
VEFQALADEYRHKTDEELLRLSLERAQLTLEANAVLSKELARRRIKTKEGAAPLHDPRIACLDDVPNVARIAVRQEFLKKWYRPVAIVPFALVVFIELRFFPESTSPIPIYFVYASLAWAGAVISYTFFLMFAVRCPVCNRRFGLGDKCTSCGLPRHRSSDSGGELSIT